MAVIGISGTVHGAEGLDGLPSSLCQPYMAIRPGFCVSRLVMTTSFLSPAYQFSQGNAMREPLLPDLFGCVVDNRRWSASAGLAARAGA